MDKNETMVIEEEVQWGRVGYILLEGNNVIFDTSCGEYGPVAFDIKILIEAIKKHTDEPTI
jgi:hypothetical protein